MMPSRAEAQPRPDDPRVVALAARLGLDRFSAFGRLAAVRALVPRVTPSRDAIDGAAEWAGFADAMLSAGLLGSDGDGLCFHALIDLGDREARRKAGDARRAREYRARQSADRPPAPVTICDVTANETERKHTPRYALPPADPSRRVIRCVADAAHVPHLLMQARLVIDHYADGVGMKAVYKQNAVVLVTDLLDAGVSQAVLLRASEAYATASKNATTKPMGPEKFFAAEGAWRDHVRPVGRFPPRR